MLHAWAGAPQKPYFCGEVSMAHLPCATESIFGAPLMRLFLLVQMPRKDFASMGEINRFTVSDVFYPLFLWDEYDIHGV
jgi:hypothetical protein